MLARTSITLVTVALLAATFAATASATTGGAPTAVAGTPAPIGSPTGTPAGEESSAGVLRLLSVAAVPRRSFYYGLRYPRISFTLASTQPQNDLRIDVVDATGASVRTFFRNDVAPGVETRIRWDGIAGDGRPAPSGRYAFRVSSQAGVPVAQPSASQPPSLDFALYGYAFPVLAGHDYGDAGSVFGAGRSSHTHQGHDVMAECGVPIVAARGGLVQYSGYQDAAGNYLVIDGEGTGFDMAYMHLAEPSPLRAGDPVRTGQPIGVLGDTGSATACHLHFEIWTGPGWYEGGTPIDPLPYLLRWDRYS